MSKYLVHTNPHQNNSALSLVNVSQQNAVARAFNDASKTFETKTLMKNEYFILANNIKLVYAMEIY
jgi:GH35 family endo-1,4-beta-xylanase